MKQILSFFKEFQQDIAFYNQNTEVFLAWTIVFGSVVVIVLSTIERGVVLLVGGIFLSAVLLVLISLTTIFYLHTVSLESEKSLLYKIHRFLNTSILVRGYVYKMIYFMKKLIVRFGLPKRTLLVIQSKTSHFVKYRTIPGFARRIKHLG